MFGKYKDYFIQNIKIPLFISIIMVALSYYNYLLYHTVVEFIAIAVGIALFLAVFMFKINFKNSFLPFIAAGYLYVSLIDLLHTFAYKGMNLLPIAGQSANLATQLWIEGRFLQAIILLISVSFIDKKLSNNILLIGMGIIFGIITLIVLTGYAPSAYIEGYGLTTFKIVMEYIIIMILCIALYRFHVKADAIGKRTSMIFSISIIFTILSELSFTFYISVFGISNLIGHIFKFFAFWYILIEARNIIKDNLTQAGN
jgi:hypothetical protein